MAQWWRTHHPDAFILRRLSGAQWWRIPHPDAFILRRLSGGSVVKNPPPRCIHFKEFIRWLSGEEPTTQCRRYKRLRFSGSIPGGKDPLEEEIAIHSSILAWKTSWTEEPVQATVHGITKSHTRLNTHTHSTWQLHFASSVVKLKRLHIEMHQFSSVAQSCLILCDPMDCSTPGFPARHQLPEPTQTHVHRVGDAIQPSHPLLSPALNLFQHQGLFQWVSCSYQVVKVLELQLQHQSFQWIFSTDFL